jgi:hypothetical protein
VHDVSFIKNVSFIAAGVEVGIDVAADGCELLTASPRHSTVNLKWASVINPQERMRIVKLWVPNGFALLIETTPVK